MTHRDSSPDRPSRDTRPQLVPTASRRSAAPTGSPDDLGATCAEVLKGVWVAVATPFAADGGVDTVALGGITQRCRDAGVAGVVALGTTGEAATLVDKERDEVIGACLESAGPLPVLIGTGSNNTRQVESWTRRAQELGAFGALIVTPYYNKPNRSGMQAHYEAISHACPDFPIVAYNVPGRTGIDLGVDATLRLLSLPNVLAVKESSGRLSQITSILRQLPEHRRVLAGDDDMALAAITHGASGVVSVVANLAPAAMVSLVEAARRGDAVEANAWHRRLAPLMESLFVETNPVPLKAALELLGLATSRVRLPLAVAEGSTFDHLSQALDLLGEAA